MPLEGEVLTLAEVKTLLEKEQKRRAELRLEQKLALTHAEHFARLPAPKAKKLRKAIKDLGVSDEISVKLADFLPRSLEEVQPLFSKERSAPTPELLQKILGTINEHAPADEVRDLAAAPTTPPKAAPEKAPPEKAEPAVGALEPPAGPPPETPPE